MKGLEIILTLSVAVVFCGCGGAPTVAPKSSASASTPTPSAPHDTTSGNWQFTAPSTIPGKAPLTFAGSLSYTGKALSGTLHVDGSDCFDRLTSIGFTNTATGTSTPLTSSVMDGQVITLAGNFDAYTFNGTYSIKGGCAAGEQGSIAGVNINNIGENLSGTFTNSAQKTFKTAGAIAQSGSASSDGTFPITGTVTFDSPCFSGGTIQPGTFPGGSFILGESVTLDVETSKSTSLFLAT